MKNSETSVKIICDNQITPLHEKKKENFSNKENSIPLYHNSPLSSYKNCQGEGCQHGLVDRRAWGQARWSEFKSQNPHGREKAHQLLQLSWPSNTCHCMHAHTLTKTIIMNLNGYNQYSDNRYLSKFGVFSTSLYKALMDSSQGLRIS